MSEDLKALAKAVRQDRPLLGPELAALLEAAEAHECGGSAAYLMGSAKAVEQANVSIEKLMAELSRASTERDVAQRGCSTMRAELEAARIERDSFVASTHRLADAIDDARATTARLEKQRDEARHAVRRLRALLFVSLEYVNEADYEAEDITNVRGFRQKAEAAIADTKETP